MSALFSGPQSQANAPIIYSGLNVGTSMFNLPVAIFWGQRRLTYNAIWYGNFTKTKVNNGKGADTKGQQPQFTYSAAVIVALCEGVVDGIRRGFPDGSTTTTATLAQFNMTLFTGTASQAPWSWIVTNDPSQARAYAYTAYLATPQIGLGESATIPDRAFESWRASSLGFAYVPTSPGWINPTTHNQDGVSGPFAADPALDCLMSDIIPDFLTSVQYGMGLVSGDIGSTAQFAAYQRAQGLHFSPYLVSQEKATAILDRWAQLSNTWIYWSGTQVQFVPLGDVAITANGATYTPVVDVAYDLTVDDFLADDEQGGGPVKVTRKDPADCFNRMVLSICDRTLGYIDNPFEWKDDFLDGYFGLRDDSSTSANEICDPLVAPIVVALLGQRGAYIRKTYVFKLSYRFTLCLPGTILTLTEPNLGLSRERVRVQSIRRDDKGQLEFTCEEYPGTTGVYTPALTATATAPNNLPDAFATPPSVNTPAVVEPDSAFTGGVAKLLLAASAPTASHFGGCAVYLSIDGVNYVSVGTITAPATQGLLTAALAAHGGANPDTGHTLAVDCTESGTIPPATASTAQAQALQTLSLVSAQPAVVGGASVLASNGELLAYGSAIASGTFAANLTYLERGAYGTSPGAHSIGDQFTLFDLTGQDGTTLAYELPAQYVGKTLYLKFASFNLFAQEQQDLSICTEYEYVPTGAGFGAGTAGAPLEPTGLAVVGTPGPGQVALAWSANAATDNVIAYQLWRAPGTGASFGSAAKVWTGLALTATDLTVAPSTGYTYFLVAVNAVGASPNTAGVNATTAASTSAGGATTLATVSTSTLTLGTPPALVWYVDVDNTSGGAIAVELPAAPQTGQVVKVTDVAGNAGANAFTIQTSTGGALTPAATIAVNYGWLTARWNGSAWVQG